MAARSGPAARFRQLYGAEPLHLLALIASLLIAGAAVVGWFDNVGSITENILIWFVGAIIGHDLVLVPLYSLLDRVAFGAFEARSLATPATPPQRAPGWVYVRVPALLSGLLALVFFPEILRLGNATFRAASGMTQDVYLSRFLLTCGVLFVVSGIAYAVSLSQARRDRDPASVDEGTLSPDTPDP